MPGVDAGPLELVAGCRHIRRGPLHPTSMLRNREISAWVQNFLMVLGSPRVWFLILAGIAVFHGFFFCFPQFPLRCISFPLFFIGFPLFFNGCPLLFNDFLCFPMVFPVWFNNFLCFSMVFRCFSFVFLCVAFVSFLLPNFFTVCVIWALLIQAFLGERGCLKFLGAQARVRAAAKHDT